MRAAPSNLAISFSISVFHALNMSSRVTCCNASVFDIRLGSRMKRTAISTTPPSTASTTSCAGITRRYLLSFNSPADQMKSQNMPFAVRTPKNRCNDMKPSRIADIELMIQLRWANGITGRCLADSPHP
jgi:hypothetical protein